MTDKNMWSFFHDQVFDTMREHRTEANAITSSYLSGDREFVDFMLQLKTDSVVGVTCFAMIVTTAGMVRMMDEVDYSVAVWELCVKQMKVWIFG